ncbi:MAG: LacI family DNA-binding transcriptional regulator, partial [Chloroflexota bacterium]
MIKKRVTSKMVAKQAGVSQTTVSFVLNKVEGQNISPETTERVIQAARDLGYVPDATARMLARGVSDNVALVLTRPHEAVLSDEFVSYIMTGIAKVLRKEPYRILVEFIDEDMQGQTYFNLAQGKEAVGLIVIPYNPSARDIETMKTLSEEGFPITTLGKLHDTINSVSTADEQGIQDALVHLYDLGHRSIGVISYAPQDSGFTPQGRLDTYEQFLTEKNLPFNPNYIIHGAFTPESGYQAALQLLSLDQPPTAILALNDVMAFGAMTAIQESGLKVPDDVAVIGYDGILLARYTSPSLTTVEAPNIEQGKLAAKMLLDIIDNKPIESRHITLTPELIIRDSCG